MIPQQYGFVNKLGQGQGHNRRADVEGKIPLGPTLESSDSQPP